MNDNLKPLAQAWLDAKHAEAMANAERLKIEAQMVEALEVPIEGSKTHKIEGYKITVTQPVTRKIDADAWAKVSAKCPTAMQPIKTKIEADAAGCRYLAEKEPAIWKRIAAAFETKPGKVGFKVEAV